MKAMRASLVTDGSFSEFGPGGQRRFDARFADGSVGYVSGAALDVSGRRLGTPARSRV